ncbi:MAG: methytransferase partner Trm112 [Dehalococcoidia bacterium]
MRHDLMEILVCPLCKGDLQLTVDKEDGDEIVDGKLVCSQCSETYPIEDGIPNLLPPDLRG